MAVEQQLSGISIQVLGGTGPFRTGQKLTISNRTVSKLAFEISEDFIGSPVGDIILTIRKVSNDSVMATKVWGDASALSGGREWIEVTFDSAVFVNEEVRILCEYYGVDTNNRFKTRYSNSDVKASENFTRWITNYSQDMAGWDCIYKYTYVAGGAPGASTVTTEECTNTIATSTTGWGHVTVVGDGAPTQHGHVWSTSQEPDTSDSKTELGAKPQTGSFTSDITGLTPGTTYYIKAYAVNTAGTNYGAEVNITTLTTIRRAHIWSEGSEFHYFDEAGVERVLQGHETASDKDLWPWLDPFS